MKNHPKNGMEMRKMSPKWAGNAENPKDWVGTAENAQKMGWKRLKMPQNPAGKSEKCHENWMGTTKIPQNWLESPKISPNLAGKHPKIPKIRLGTPENIRKTTRDS